MSFESVSTLLGVRNGMARCPAHGDRTASLSVTEAEDGKTLLKCHANQGCTYDSIVTATGIDAAEFRGTSRRSSTRARIVATYPYVDENDVLLFEAVRFEPKDFRQRRPDGNGGWSWKLGDVRRVLYRLPAVLAAAQAGGTVYIVEGEKDVAALERENVVATCNPMGAGKWKPEHTESLSGASRIVIVADRDDSGYEHARTVADSCRSAGLDVMVLEASHGKDVAEHLGAGKTLDELRPVTEKPIEPPRIDAEEPRSKRSQASELVDLALSSYRLGFSEDGGPFAVALDGPNIARPLRGGRDSFRAEIAARYRQAHGKVASSGALADAMNTLEGEAGDIPREPVALRIATYEDGIVLDLGDETGAAVVVNPRSWEVVERSPVLFHRTELTAVLPVPAETGGDHNRLRELLNVSDETWPLLVGWLVVVLLPQVATPIMLLRGEQGSGKSTAARMLGSVIDPSPVALRTAPKDVESWATVAVGSWVVAIDNISSVQPWFSDVLCRAVTGDGVVKRRLYTDGEIHVISFRRAIILTSIDPGALKGDLSDRLLPIELHRMEKRGYDAELAAAYEDAHPVILGGLLDLLVEVLAALPEIRLEDPPRMADAARIFAAVDEVIGVGALDAYLRTVGDVAAEVVEGDQIAQAVAALMEDRAVWDDTATALLAAITPEHPSRSWPTNARSLSGRLRNSVPALRSLGIEIEFYQAGHTRKRGIRITSDADANEAAQILRPQFASADRSRSEQAGTDGYGADAATGVVSLFETDREKKERPSAVETAATDTEKKLVGDRSYPPYPPSARSSADAGREVF